MYENDESSHCVVAVDVLYCVQLMSQRIHDHRPVGRSVDTEHESTASILRLLYYLSRIFTFFLTWFSPLMHKVAKMVT